MLLSEPPEGWPVPKGLFCHRHAVPLQAPSRGRLSWPCQAPHMPVNPTARLFQGRMHPARNWAAGRCSKAEAVAGGVHILGRKTKQARKPPVSWPRSCTTAEYVSWWRGLPQGVTGWTARLNSQHQFWPHSPWDFCGEVRDQLVTQDSCRLSPLPRS